MMIWVPKSSQMRMTPKMEEVLKKNYFNIFKKISKSVKRAFGWLFYVKNLIAQNVETFGFVDKYVSCRAGRIWIARRFSRKVIICFIILFYSLCFVYRIWMYAKTSTTVHVLSEASVPESRVPKSRVPKSRVPKSRVPKSRDLMQLWPSPWTRCWSAQVDAWTQT